MRTSAASQPAAGGFFNARRAIHGPSGLAGRVRPADDERPVRGGPFGAVATAPTPPLRRFSSRLFLVRLTLAPVRRYALGIPPSGDLWPFRSDVSQTKRPDPDGPTTFSHPAN